MAKIFADARCNEAILTFLGEAEVGLKRRCGEVDWKRILHRGGQVGGRGVVTSFCFLCLVCEGRCNVLTYGGPSTQLVRAAGEKLV